MTNTVKIYIPLLEEGSATIRGTQAIPLGEGLYKVLPATDYDPDDEIWEFLPDSVVRCEDKLNFGERIILAVEKIK